MEGSACPVGTTPKALATRSRQPKQVQATAVDCTPTEVAGRGRIAPPTSSQRFCEITNQRRYQQQLFNENNRGIPPSPWLSLRESWQAQPA